MPALALDDGGVLTEGPAIVQLIADKVGGGKLAPANGTPERYRLQEWLNFISTDLHKSFGPLFSPVLPDEAKQFFRDRIMQISRLCRQAARRQGLSDGLAVHAWPTAICS